MLQSVFSRLRIGPGSSADPSKQDENDGTRATFTSAKTASSLFPTVCAEMDGPECAMDCHSCTTKYPASFSIDEKADMYGHISDWSTHLLIATGKTDWIHNVDDEKGSIARALHKCPVKATNGTLKVSTSNMPLPDEHEHEHEHEQEDGAAPDRPTTAILLPSFTLIHNLRRSNVAELMTRFVNAGPTNQTRIGENGGYSAADPVVDDPAETAPEVAVEVATETASATEAAPAPAPSSPPNPTTLIPQPLPPTTTTHTLTSSPCPHDYLILLCSHRTRDARCGQTAPLLAREFARHLRPLDLHRDLHDTRPGGVGIYFINHVGGHKFAANVIIYRSNGGSAADGGQGQESAAQGQTTDLPLDRLDGIKEATQCIWLARVRPKDCENIVKFTILQGKVVKPETQLRGGFDRQRGLTSW